jgi:ceramide glucosyltransferase
MTLFWCSVGASAVAGIGCGYLITATILLRRLARDGAAARPAATPAVTILKPLHGNEAGLLENLSSFCAQDYPGEIQIICGVQHAGDGALAIVERLRELKQHCHLDVVVDAKVHGLNRKVSNLVNMAPRVRHEVVVLADSDIRVDPGYLCRVIAALEQPAVGAVTCLYYGVALTGVWARLAALLTNAQFLPSVVVALGFGLAHPCFGSTLALRREALTAIGGFEPFVDCLADDYAMGAALRAHGRNVVIPRFAVAHICTQTSLRELWRHQLRWARTIRSIDPIGYAGSLVSHPLGWALLALLLGAGSTALLPAVGVAIAAIACRMAVLREVERAYPLPSQPYWLVPACDLLSFAVFAISFLNWKVSWRGHRFRMVAGDWTADRGTNQ